MANTKGNTLRKRLGSMLRVDIRRLLLSRAFYIIVAACLLALILILVMTTMMDGTVTVDHATGKETVIEGFESVWQILGTVSEPGAGAGAGGIKGTMSMDLVSMCNINMLYFAIAVLVCLFVADDFRSGYAKNLFTTHPKKSDYVISKTLVLSFGAAVMMLAFFVGAMLGGLFSGLSFALVGAHAGNVVACLIAKILLCPVFIGIYLTMSVIGKQRLWLSLLLSFGVGMLLFTVAPMVTPLNSGILQIVLCLAGGGGFALGLGAVSDLILERTSLV